MEASQKITKIQKLIILGAFYFGVSMRDLAKEFKIDQDVVENIIREFIKNG